MTHDETPSMVPILAGKGVRADVDALLADAGHRTPEHDPVDLADPGAVTALQGSPFARRTSGETIYVDGGYPIPGGTVRNRL